MHPAIELLDVTKRYRSKTAVDRLNLSVATGSIHGFVGPNGSGKTPNPAGSSKDGWFKIYRGGSDLSFKWQSSTSDNDGHDIYVEFDTAGVYTMEISARSSGHAIDQFVLFKAPQTKTDAIASGNTFSTFDCN